MANLRVWNHGPDAQKRPVQFTVPLGLSWGDTAQVTVQGTGEVLYASKQWDDGVDAVFVCPPPADGWPRGTTVTDPNCPYSSHTIANYTGQAPVYRYRLASVFGTDECGATRVLDPRFVPELHIYPTASSVTPLVVRLESLLPWSPGAYPSEPRFIAVTGVGPSARPSGDRRNVYAGSGHNQGWHLYFSISFDSELRVAEYGATFGWSDHTAAGAISTTGVDAWRTLCDRVELVWPATMSVKPKFTQEGFTFASGHSIVHPMEMGARTLGSSDSDWDSWGNRASQTDPRGKWTGQIQFVSRGFLLGRASDNSTTPEADDMFDKAEALYACLDEELWDGEWFGGGSSGYSGARIVNKIPMYGPQWADTTAGYMTWDRGCGQSGSTGNTGMIMSTRPQSTGGQGGQGLANGHAALLGVNSPRDFEAAAHDAFRRWNWIWRRNPGDESPNTAFGVFWETPGRCTLYNYQPYAPDPLILFAGKIHNQASGFDYLFGRQDVSAAVALSVPRATSINNNYEQPATGLPDQHYQIVSYATAAKLLKDPVSMWGLSWILQTAELGAWRPNTGAGSDLNGSREIGRLFGALSTAVEANPGLASRIHDLVYNETTGLYLAMTRSVLKQDRDPDTDSRLPDLIDPNTGIRPNVPRWFKSIISVSRDFELRTFQPSEFLYGPDAIETPITDGAVTFAASGDTITRGSGIWPVTPEVGATVKVAGTKTIVTTSNCSFDAGTKTITLDSGSWTRTPIAGTTITIAGTGANNGGKTVVSATSNTIVVSNTLTTGSALSKTITSNLANRGDKTVVAADTTTITVSNALVDEQADHVSLQSIGARQTTRTFGYHEGFEFVGCAGLFMWYDTIIATGGLWGRISTTDIKVTNPLDWAETAMESLLIFLIAEDDSYAPNPSKHMPCEVLLTYIDGSMMQTAEMQFQYPPGDPAHPGWTRHPFMYSSHPLASAMWKYPGSNEQSWYLGGILWYSLNGRNPTDRAKAAQVVRDTRSVHTPAAPTAINGWQQVHWQCVAAL